MRQLACTTLVAALAACSSPPPGASAITQPDRLSVVYPAGSRVLVVVAHQDDDLPHLPAVVEAGIPIHTVFLTAGDAGYCADYANARAEGNRRAYARAAAIAPGNTTEYAFDDSDWSFEEALVPGTDKWVVRAELRGAPVTQTYFGFRNNALGATGDDQAALFLGEVEVLTSLDYDGRTHTSSYTSAELVQALGAIIDAVAPTHLETFDATFLWPPVPELLLDHPDHLYTSAFTLMAAQRGERSYEYMMHRAYSVWMEPVNLDRYDVDAVRPYFDVYAESDPKICAPTGGRGATICAGTAYEARIQCDSRDVYELFAGRHYAIGVAREVTGPIRRQGECLAVMAGEALGLTPCDGSLAQRWHLTSDGMLRAEATGSCASSSGEGEPVTLAPCDATERGYLLDTAGQVRGPGASCLEVTDGGPVFAPCRDAAPEQVGWAAQLSPRDGALRVDGALIGVVAGPDGPHLCVRRTDGVHCGGFAPDASAFEPTVHLPARDEPSEWDVEARGVTAQLASIDRSAHVDLCLRDTDGVYCASGSDDGFASLTRRTRAFGDEEGFDEGPSYFASIRVVDVTADGLSDVCGRGREGLLCSVNDGTGQLGPGLAWSAEGFFSDAGGFGRPDHGGTLVFGDINGDGTQDACARGRYGVVCALNFYAEGRTTRFARLTRWSDRDDFSDAAGWERSRADALHLVDLDGDGRADLCGWNAAGLWCGLSLRDHFSSAQLMLAADRVGGTAASRLTFADADRDGHAELYLETDGVVRVATTPF